jgi:hypothetical protein
MALSWDQILGILLIIGTLYLRSRSEDSTPMPTGKAIEVDKYGPPSALSERRKGDE